MIGWLYVVLAMACGGNDSTSETADKPTAMEEAKDDLSSNPDYKKGLALVGQSDCLTCHKIREQHTGPAYVEIAEKYRGADEATVSMLAKTIINGGSGNWGAVPMTPHPDLSEEDARAMVKYILLLKK